MIKLSVCVPESHLETVKRAMFEAGAGRMGNYAECAWQTLGTGQFRPLPGSDPYIGSSGDLSVVPEYQVEMVCRPELLSGVIEALKRAHPYETPAYAAWQVLDL